MSAKFLLSTLVKFQPSMSPKLGVHTTTLNLSQLITLLCSYRTHTDIQLAVAQNNCFQQSPRPDKRSTFPRLIPSSRLQNQDPRRRGFRPSMLICQYSRLKTSTRIALSSRARHRFFAYLRYL